MMVSVYRILRFNGIYRIHDPRCTSGQRGTGNAATRKKKHAFQLSKIYAEAPSFRTFNHQLRKLDKVDSFWPFPFSDGSRLPFNTRVKGELTKNRLMDRILWCLYLAALAVVKSRENDTVHPHLRHSCYT